MDGLPLELVLTCLRLSLDDPTEWRHALRLMLIRKSWTSMARTLLYDRVYLDNHDRVEGFRDHVWHSAIDKTVQLPAGHLVLHLEIPDSFNSQSQPISVVTSFVSSLSVVLLHTPNLRHYRNRFSGPWHHQLPHLILLSRICKSSLRSLDLILTKELGVSRAINELVGLQVLKIEVDTLYPWPHVNECPIELTTIKHLDCIVNAPEKAVTLALLARSRIAADSTVHFQMNSLNAEEVQILLAFFTLNSVQTFHLDCVGWNAQAALALAIKHIPNIEMCSRSPITVLAQHDHLPLQLSVQYDPPEDMRDDDGFWQFLRAVSAGKIMLPQILTKVRVLRGSTRFSWLPRDTEEGEATFVGRLLPFAFELYDQEIYLVDDQDKDMSMYKPANGRE